MRSGHRGGAQNGRLGRPPGEAFEGGQGEGREEGEAQTRRFHGADVVHGTMEWLASTVAETSGAVVVHARGVASGAVPESPSEEAVA